MSKKLEPKYVYGPRAVNPTVPQPPGRLIENRPAGTVAQALANAKRQVAEANRRVPG
jgi:hypothetical protein